MQHGSLFSGIGGFDLAASWMGWENRFQCENDSFCRKVLQYYWPKAVCYEDIKTTDFIPWRGAIDVLTGGFPCQPFSGAGQKKGTGDDRYLWPAMFRAIREIQPRWVLGENVRGLVNWSNGLVFDQVQSDLEVEGFEVFPVLLPACSVGAPHRRDRIFFAAYAGSNGFKRNKKSSEYDNPGIQKGLEKGYEPDTLHGRGNVTDTNRNQRCEGRMHTTGSKKTERYPGSCDTWDNGHPWQNFPTQSPVCPGNDGLSSKLDGITLSKWRTGSIRAAGNAIVPQVALKIFKAIAEMEKSEGFYGKK